MSSERLTVLNPKALTKIQATLSIALITIAAVAGSSAYFLWLRPASSTENIKIGICADLDMINGKAAYRGALLAIEQINARGGLLGRNLTLVAEDDDSNTQPYDVAVATNALNRLIAVDEADFIVACSGGTLVFTYQDICSEHKKILFTTLGVLDNYTQRVVEDYENYKYFFRTYPANQSAIALGSIGDAVTAGKYTGFTKIGFLFQDGPAARAMVSSLNSSLPNYGFEIVYINFFTLGTTDFTSYFSAIEASGAEILVPFIPFQEGIPFVKEWYDRQSPFVIWGTLTVAQDSDFWELSEGKCEYVSFYGLPVISGYPLTNKTLPTRQAYMQRWGEVPSDAAVATYDTIRFILPDAITRAGTTETEAVIKALETSDVETSMARHWVFTSSHDVLVGSSAPNNPAQDYMVMAIFQWQNGIQVPMRPEEIMKEAGATYKFPFWDGPWNK